ncbi:MAG: hypothetical protein ACLR0U_03440 [Enterocloster clostridioformis]
MATQYNHSAIEKSGVRTGRRSPSMCNDGREAEKYYCLDMFPYPSGNGLHVGHWRGYVISDVWSRYQAVQGLVCHSSHGVGCLRPSLLRTTPSRWAFIRLISTEAEHQEYKAPDQ